MPIFEAPVLPPFGVFRPFLGNFLEIFLPSCSIDTGLSYKPLKTNKIKWEELSRINLKIGAKKGVTSIVVSQNLMVEYNIIMETKGIILNNT